MPWHREPKKDVPNCDKPVSYTHLEEECKLRIEAPVNGGRNYNGPKVAKFLVTGASLLCLRTEESRGCFWMFLCGIIFLQ